jgi:hypothetical protein
VHDRRVFGLDAGFDEHLRLAPAHPENSVAQVRLARRSVGDRTRREHLRDGQRVACLQCESGRLADGHIGRIAEVRRDEHAHAASPRAIAGPSEVRPSTVTRILVAPDGSPRPG